MSEARRPRRRRAHVVVWSLLALGLVAIAVLGIAGYRLVDGTMTVKAHLEDARTQLGEFQLAASEQRFSELPNLASTLHSSAEAAVAPTTDGLWRLGEQVPWVGANLRAVRTIAEGGESVSREVVSPACSADSRCTGTPQRAGSISHRCARHPISPRPPRPCSTRCPSGSTRSTRTR